MSSTLQSTLTALQQNNYVTLAVITAVGYDYILVFPKEVEYIWIAEQTVDLGIAIICSCPLLWSLHIDYSIPPWKYFVTWSYRGDIVKTIEHWVYILFLGAADFVMILRVWAMYSRSRLIFKMLLTLFSLEVVIMVVAASVYSNLKIEQEVTVQILQYSVCALEVTEPIWAELSTILQITFSAALLLLAIVQFVIQSFQIYRATKRWQLNRYMNLLITQGILYFFVVFLLNFITLLDDTGKIPSTSWQVVLAAIVEYVPVYTLTPRFIISVRELYAQDVQGGRVGGIDTGFGLSALSGGGAEVGGAIVFADAMQSEEMEGVEADEGPNEETENRIEEIPREIRLA